MHWAEHVARKEKMRNAHKILVVKPEGMTQFGTPRRRWEDNIKMNFK
jgi:hypothetical protein